MGLRWVRRMLVVSSAVLFLGGALAGCGASRENLTVSDEELLGGTQAGDFAQKVAEGEQYWAQRIERAQLERAIATWEEALTLQSEGDTAQRRLAVGDLYTRISRGYYLLADGFARFDSGDSEAAMKKFYDKGVVAAEKALYAYSAEYQQAVASGKSREEALSLLGPEANGALYWYATNLGKWAVIEGIGEALGQVDTIKAMVGRLERDEPSYFYYAPFRYFGGYYTKLPFPGGDAEKSKSYFEKAIASAPQYLGSRVLYAEMYAVKVDDEDLFREQLQIVLDAPADADPEIEAENLIEKKKAQKLLDDADDFF